MPTPAPIQRTIDQLIASLRQGGLATELTCEMRNLVQLCADTGRPGEITLTLKLKPGKAGQLEVIDEVKVKPPKPERGTTLMFATPDGNLQRNDPRQMEIEGLRDVSAKAAEHAELRTADGS